MAQQPHQNRLSKSLPHPQQEERKKTKLRRHRKKDPTHRNRDHQRWGLQPKHRRLAIGEEREAENRQTERKRAHHKGSQGIEAKIPKKEQKSPN